MLYCSNPTCSNPFSPDGNKFCLSCGSQTLSPLFHNRYRVIQLLGEGGFGRTYEAIDTDRMDDPCVIKQFFPQVQGMAVLEKATELFKQEAKRLYELGEHPQIPRLIAYFEQDKRLYLVQELIEGQTLLAELQQQGAFNEEKIRQLLADLLPVLKIVHERGVIHRDIKPENIMRRRKDGKLMLIDFGISKQVTATILGHAGTTIGTHGYASMEQMRGQVYPASDLYSLGVTCIRLLTQCLPKEDGSDELYDALNGKWIWRERLPKSITISPQLGQVLEKLTQNYVRDRYQSADEVLRAFNPASSAPSNSSAVTAISNNMTFSSALNSTVVKEYSKLQELLAEGKWQEADEETQAIMFEVFGYPSIFNVSLYPENIKVFPCENLRKIDQLWVQHSNGRFGFSGQKQIWKSVNKEWNFFCDRVGWRVNGNWLSYNNLTFTLEAPVAHLPGLRDLRYGRWFGRHGLWVQWWVILFSRVEACGL
ncbi:serine/threonine-protein kinase [Microcoleus sp. ZQ-A2]|nr:GUN4 domain-containing protein [Microcoleus sp. FACHB-1]